MRKVCVLGLGYIGLPTAAMLATHGYEVVGVDINENVVHALNDGGIHIQEAGLKELVQEAIVRGTLHVSRRPEPCDGFIIAVPTPFAGTAAEYRRDDGQLVRYRRADLSAVISATESVVPCVQPGNLIVLESTVPPLTTEQIVTPILERSGLHVSRRGQAPDTGRILVAHCPERVLPGRILHELVENDRIVGGVDKAAAEVARDLYASFVKGTILLTDAKTAEMVKLMENTYRDVNIALANEFALVSEKLGINVWEAIQLANHHPRVRVLEPGPGVGGHCIAVDPWFIVETAPELTELLQSARHVNDGMPHHVVALVQDALRGLSHPVVACFGLSYKANIDDIRESPALQVVMLLQELGYEVRSYDPHVRAGVIAGQVGSPHVAVDGADAVVILTDHASFGEMLPGILGKSRAHVLIDTRNTFGHAGLEMEVIRLGDGQSLLPSPAVGKT